MDDTHKRPQYAGRLASDRVAELSDEARAEIARSLAGRTSTGGDAPSRRADPGVGTPVRRAAKASDPDAGAEAARLAAELHRTERRLDRLERGFTHSRYQTGGSSVPTGRYARLLARADRLERQLRSLR